MRVGIATKITVPFVLLSASLIALLGILVSQAILPEVENRVVGQLQSTLRFATYQFESKKLREQQPTYYSGLLQMASGFQPNHGDMTLVILGLDSKPITTIPPTSPRYESLVGDLLKRIQDDELFPGLKELAHPDQYQDEGTSRPPTRAELENIQNEDKEFEIKRTRSTLDHEDHLVFYKMVPVTTKQKTRKIACFLLTYPERHIEAARTQALNRIVFLVFLGILLAALLGRAVAQIITRPIRRLAASAGKVASGGLTKAVEIRGSQAMDEIGDLTRSFESMVYSLRKLQEKQVKAERLATIGKLAASVAHEIRNPLTSLRMTMQMLRERDENPDEDTQEAYEVVLNEVDRLALSVEELLTFARPRPPQRQPTDLNKLIHDTVRFLDRQMKHAHVTVKPETDPALPNNVLLDPNKIRQLLVNLLLNAMQAMVREGEIIVSTRWDPNLRCVKLGVLDTGPGIAEEIREQVFDIFVSTKPAGGGLGLAVAKQVVEEHGGKITFDSSPKGTSFHIELPVPEYPPVSE